MYNIFQVVKIKSTDIHKIFGALVEQKGLSSWWTTAVKAEPIVGSIAEFTFSPTYSKKMKILNIEENKMVEWECIEGHVEWIATKIFFIVEPHSDYTIIKFTHTGWKEQTDMYGECSYHWALYMESLEKYITTGKGKPSIVKV